MAVKTLSWMLCLAVAGPALAQTPAVEIRVTGEHRAASGDTAELARGLALVDARRKAWAAAVTQLQSRADLKALGLTPAQVEAYTAVIVEIEEPPAPTAPAPSRPLVQVPVQVRFDATETVRRMAGLRKDPDATHEVLAAWTGMQQLHDQLAARTAPDQQRNLTALTATYLAARASAALARTEESTVGGRAPSDEGRRRARQLAEAALALSPDSAVAHSVMGDILLDAQEPDAAETEYRKALLANANSGPGRTKLAEALRLQGNFTDAIAELREAIRIDPNLAQPHSDLGMILRAQQKGAEAIEAYREALRLDPDSVDAHNGLAVTLAGEKRLEDAVVEFREIVRIDPDSAIGYYNLAYALADLDRDEESAAALREVIRINPNHYNARFNLGELFRLEGKYDESAKQFREYLRLAPETPQNRRNIQRARGYVEKFEGR
jgi:tetratricopeptide (TPR) repeat protein